MYVLNENTLLLSQPTTQQLTDYVNAVNLVNSYAWGITNQDMPVLTHPPANYSDFQNSFVPAKTHALTWSQEIFVNMIYFPKNIAQLPNDIFMSNEMAIEYNLNILIEDPANATAKGQLAKGLQNIRQQVTIQLHIVENILNELTQFSGNIQTDAVTLANISAQYLSYVKDDQEEIKKINNDINSLRQNIASAQKLLVASEIGTVTSIFFGLIGGVVCMIPGAQGAGIGIMVTSAAGLGVSIAGDVIETQIIQDSQDLILADQKQISDINQDIILMNAISGQFNTLYEANLQAQNSLIEIKTVWQNLDSAIANISAELTSVNNEVTAAQYSQALSDMQTANDNWNDVIQYANALAGLQFQWQDANGEWHNYDDQPPMTDNGLVTPITTVA